MTKRISGTASSRGLPLANDGRMRRKCLLLLVAVVAGVVLGLGLAVGDHVRHPAPLTGTEKAQLTALDTANRLAENAAMLAKVSVPATVPTSSDKAGDSSAKAAQQDPFAAAAEVLRQQARLLQSPLLARTQAGQSTTEQSPAGQASAVARLPAQAPDQRPSPRPSPPEGTASTPEDFIAELASSAQDNLAGARTSNPGIARLLASIGTGQLLLAIELADRHQLPLPAFTPEDTVHPDLPAARPSTCPSPDPTSRAPSDSASSTVSATPSSTVSATPSSTVSVAGPGPGWGTQSTALLSVLRAEEHAAYAYEVASADMRAPASAASRERHVLAAGELRGLLHRACISAQPQLEAYAVTPEFLDNPGAGLEQLEQQLLASYADLIGLSSTDDGHTGNARTWAVNQLARSAFQHRNPEAMPSATPGLSW